MPSRFETRFNARVIPAAERAFGVDARIQRGSLTVNVTVFPGSVSPKLATEDGQAYIELHGIDWEIQVSEYTFTGVDTKPLPGDVLTRLDTNEAFIVSPYAQGQPCWRYSDRSRFHLVVHTLPDSS